MAEIVLKYFMMAVTLIVMAVPEGLPMAITLLWHSTCEEC